MNPALVRFLNVLKEKLNKTANEITSDLTSLSALHDLRILLTDFINTKEINNEIATQFIHEFDSLKARFQRFCEKNPSAASLGAGKIAASLFNEIEHSEIYILKLLLHENKSNQEFNLSFFAEHFAPFLQCPFQVKLENDELKFVFNTIDLQENEKWRFNAEYFFRALVNLGMEPHKGNPSIQDNREIIAIIIPEEHINDMLCLAQFELINKKSIPSTQTELEQKFRKILIELIQTEVSFSRQCEELATLLEKKLNPLECELTQEEEKLLRDAQRYYQGIANNRYPWFGEKYIPEKLNRMSFDEMLQLCHKLYEQLRTTNKADEISRRLAIMRWVPIEYIELNRIINVENKLELPNDDNRGSDKQIAKQNLILLVQRLPRLILLFGELTKCVNPEGVVFQQLNVLNEKWRQFAIETNELIKQREHDKPSDNNAVQRIFRSFSRLIPTNKEPDFSASIIQPDFANEFRNLPDFTHQSHSDENLPTKEIPSIVLTTNDDENLDDFYDLLTQSMIFADLTASVAAETDKETLSAKSNKKDKTVPDDETIVIQDSNEKKTVSPSSPLTRSQIGGGVAIFAGIVLIAAGIVLTLLQPELIILAAILVIEGCILASMGATLLEAKPAPPIDFDKDPNTPHFLGVDVGKKDKFGNAIVYSSLLDNTKQVTFDESNSSDNVPKNQKNANV